MQGWISNIMIDEFSDVALILPIGQQFRKQIIRSFYLLTWVAKQRKIDYMNMRILFSSLFVLLCLLGLYCSGNNPINNGNKPPVPLENKVWIESDTVSAGTKVAVRVMIENREPLTAFEVPLSFSGERIVLDSVSFIGTRLRELRLSNKEIESEGQRLLVYTATSGQEVFDSGTGVAFLLYFWVWGNSPTQDIKIDTIIFPDSHHFAFADSAQVLFTPKFQSGILHVDGYLNSVVDRTSIFRLPPR